MPLKYRTIIQVLTSHGFVLIRQKGTHRQFEGFIVGKRHVVTIACHSENEEVLPNTLQSIIRQSGLPKRLFR